MQTLVLKGLPPLLVAACLAAAAGAQTPEPRCFKGNTHTLNSNGDSAPGAVAAGYREQGYHFLVAWTQPVGVSAGQGDR